MTIEIYTDGGCRPNPGVGGWAAILRYKGHSKEIYGGEIDTTNNRMELMAVIQGLKAITRPRQIVEVYTDSQYVRNGMTKWIDGWAKRGWKTKGKAIKNVDLWQELAELCAKHNVSFNWIRGHAGHAMNERADELATIGLNNASQGTFAESHS
ncbi:ribonuclease HI [Galbibacter sp. BG1]